MENYLSSAEVLEGFYRDAVRLSGVRFESTAVVSRFEDELGRFHCCVMPLMAWILAARRSGLKPNLGDVDLGRLVVLSPDCAIGPPPRGRARYLARYGSGPRRWDSKATGGLQRVEASPGEESDTGEV